MDFSKLDPFIIYHGNCDDGFGAAYAAWKVFGNKAVYHEGIYNQKIPFSKLEHKDVFILDFSYPLNEMHEIINLAKSVVILDHHKTAVDRLQVLLDDGMLDGEFDMERSGAMMAWNYFHPNLPAPDLIKCIQDNDLWKHEISSTKNVIAALRSYPKNFYLWKGFMEDPIFTLYEEGVHINRFIQCKVDEVIKNSYEDEIAGFHVPVVNCPPFLVSEVAGKMAKGKPFSAAYYEINGLRIYSLRSEQGAGEDVSIIAQKFGGGGHKNASGFSVEIYNKLNGCYGDEHW